MRYWLIRLLLNKQEKELLRKAIDSITRKLEVSRVTEKTVDYYYTQGDIDEFSELRRIVLRKIVK